MVGSAGAESTTNMVFYCWGNVEPEINTIYQGDCIEVMKQWPEGFVAHCIADPPFNMSKKRGLGWAFSSHVTMQEGWDRFSSDEFFQFNLEWMTEACRLVKPNGNIVIFGTYHNIYQIGFILQEILKRRIINSIIWFKPNAQPNITARMLTESTEQLIWAVNETPERAKRWTFNYQLAKTLAGGKQMRTVWAFRNGNLKAPQVSTNSDEARRTEVNILDNNGEEAYNLWEIPYPSASEKRHGKHPSQKPEALLDRLIQILTNQNDLILDPFSGAGTTGLVAEKLSRRWIMIENTEEYVKIASERLKELRSKPKLPFMTT